MRGSVRIRKQASTRPAGLVGVIQATTMALNSILPPLKRPLSDVTTLNAQRSHTLPPLSEASIEKCRRGLVENGNDSSVFMRNLSEINRESAFFVFFFIISRDKKTTLLLLERGNGIERVSVDRSRAYGIKNG
ncbi:hypothetical protein MRB53_016365 [Persea americana]|uniref:Uncharacterized protein n=1 Tax=Persea americana TaxID=3435 RepID=A0ACC2M1M1_PERAE|nr:hypothetical protein MRB53_016365 [Persea americana]